MVEPSEIMDDLDKILQKYIQGYGGPGPDRVSMVEGLETIVGALTVILDDYNMSEEGMSDPIDPSEVGLFGEVD
jgi:hypothetical protein